MRQLLGAANIDGSPSFHVMSGNLSYQVEHHLFPDMPSSRYQQIAPRVKEICERYGLPYNTGPFRKQLGLGAADDPPARVSRRRTAAEAGPYRRPPEPLESVVSQNGDRAEGPQPAFP